jgi:ribosomal protein RSM22 (predicted rRNA methylase)
MGLPTYLDKGLDELAPQLDLRSLAAASQNLIRRYRSGDSASPALRNFSDRAAYLFTRFPATFAADLRVFRELRRRAPEIEVRSLLDLGAGPGTALFAAAEVFPQLDRATLVESDLQWLQTGKKLSASSPSPAVRNAQWVQLDLRKPAQFEPHDLVVISYALGELNARVGEEVVQRAWQSGARFLVIVEPGTRRGFAGVNAARSLLIGQSADILAPCPHKHVCPMAAVNDWCHFSQRLPRSSEHRRLKAADLGYEDEKFSYVIATRVAVSAAKSRIVRHPRKHSGHVQLELCTADGLVHRTIPRSQKEPYRRARHAEWGEEFSDATDESKAR